MSSSTSDPAGQPTPTKVPSGGRKSLDDILGGGKVADVVLWRNKELSAGILAAVTVLWLLLEKAEYHFLTLLCHIAIAAVLGGFIWSNAADLAGLPPPNLPEVPILSEKAFKEFAGTIHSMLGRFVYILYGIACAKDLKWLLWTIASLLILAMIGSRCSSLGLFYFVFLCIQLLPVLYQQYKNHVDDLVTKGSHELEKLLAKFDQQVLKKNPPVLVKEKKAD